MTASTPAPTFRPADSRCPHTNIVHCPLYHAAHIGDPDGLGCVTGDWHLGCAIERGDADYANEVERVRAKHPRLVAELALAESAAQANEQRKRNMRALGIH